MSQVTAIDFTTGLIAMGFKRPAFVRHLRQNIVKLRGPCQISERGFSDRRRYGKEMSYWMTREMVVQGAIASRLMQAGVSPEVAYIVGANFACDGCDGKGPCRLGAKGSTWLAVAPHLLGPDSRRGQTFFSDGPGVRSRCGHLFTADFTGGAGLPVILLNLSELLGRIDRRLGGEVEPHQGLAEAAA
jgi:hypothetical protein